MKFISKKNKKINNKNKEKNALIYILKYYKKYKIFIILTFILSWTYAGIGIVIPMIEGNMLAMFNLEFSINTLEIVKMALILMTSVIIQLVIIHFWSCTVLHLNAKVNFDIKKSMLNNILNIKLKSFDENGSRYIYD